MGRGETWAQDGDAWYSSAGSYQLWRGAKPGAKTGHVPWKSKGPKTSEKPRFPAYDAPSPPAKGGSKGSQGMKSHDAKEADEGMVSQVQKALNHTRKAEVRLSKLVKDREKAESQWQAYAVAARDAFYKERERHAKALKSYDRDIVEAQAMQSEARRALRDQIMRAEQEQEPEAMETEAGDGEWERMIEAHERETVMADDAVLRRALLEVQRTRSMTPPTRTRSQLSGVPQCSGEAPGYRPVYEGSSPTLRMARTDPYPPASPRMPVPAEDREIGHDGPPEPMPERPRTSPIHPGMRSATGARQGIKEATKAAPTRETVHMDLAEKLQAKRSALSPFGVAPGPSTEVQTNPPPEPVEQLTEPIEGAPAGHSQVLLDDDSDLHSTGNEE